MESYLPAALGFFAGLSVGLSLSLVLCVWWVRTIHKSMFEEPPIAEPFLENSGSDDAPVHEEESEEWWKRS